DGPDGPDGAGRVGGAGGHARSAIAPAAIPASAPMMRPRLSGSGAATTATLPPTAAATSVGGAFSAPARSAVKMSGTTKSSCHESGATAPTVAPNTPANDQASQLTPASTAKYAPGAAGGSAERKRTMDMANTWSVVAYARKRRHGIGTGAR